MNKKSLKRAAALALAATLAFGSAVTVFAAEEGEGTNPEAPATPAAGVGEGTGSYEGGEMKYPTLSVTLPTIPAGTYDYIADPNGLIEATNNEKYQGATFTGTTGIFFETSEDTYTEKSAAQTVTNENAQDIDVTVKLEQKTAGSSIIEYASSATFEDEDKANKLYLAVTDGAASNPKVAALSANGAAEIKVTVAGIPGNYEAGYDATNGYQYTQKDAADLTDWNECSFILTGAINMNATWGDDVTFPEIKVTWSYKEHSDAPTATSVSAAAKASTITGLPADATLSKVEFVKTDNSVVAMESGTHYRYASGTFTVLKDALLGSSYVGGKFKLTFGETVVEIPVVAATTD